MPLPHRAVTWPVRGIVRFLPLFLLAALLGVGSAALSRYLAQVWTTSTAETRPPHQRWFTEEVVVTLDDSLRSLGPEVESALQAAFDTWRASGARVPSVRFEWGSGLRPSLTPDGINSVLVAPIDFAGHETDLAITIGFSHPKSGEITEADIVVNARHAFSVLGEDALASHEPSGSPSAKPRPLSCTGKDKEATCGQIYDLQNVLTHEVGHFWGLPEDYEDRSSTMYSCTSACETHKRRLSEADLRSVQRLYAAAPATGCTARPRAAGPLQIGAALAVIAGLGLAGLFWRARRRTAQPGTSTNAPNGGSLSRSDCGRP